MELVLRGAIVYLVLFVLMRATGNRQFSQMTAFDAVLVILIAEVTGQALVGEDHSVTAAVVVLATIVAIDLALSIAKRKSRRFGRVVDGIPVLLVDEGRLVEEAMRRERVDREDILHAAREKRGLESLEEVKYAVLEPNGAITIIPWR